MLPVMPLRSNNMHPSAQSHGHLGDVDTLVDWLQRIATDRNTTMRHVCEGTLFTARINGQVAGEIRGEDMWRHLLDTGRLTAPHSVDVT